MKIYLSPSEEGSTGYSLEHPVTGKNNPVGTMGKQQRFQADLLANELKYQVLREMARSGWIEVRPFVWWKG